MQLARSSVKTVVFADTYTVPHTYAYSIVYSIYVYIVYIVYILYSICIHIHMCKCMYVRTHTHTRMHARMHTSSENDQVVFVGNNQLHHWDGLVNEERKMAV